MKTYDKFKKWCSETKRSGGVLVGSSIKQFCDYLDSETIEQVVEINEPKLIGYTNRVFGFNGCEKAEIGTPVYEHEGKYQISFKMISSQKDYVVTWYKDAIKGDIDFITS